MGGEAANKKRLSTIVNKILASKNGRRTIPSGRLLIGCTGDDTENLEASELFPG